MPQGSKSPSRVLRSSNWFKVSGIDAALVAAQVVDRETFWDLAAQEFPYEAMGSNGPATIPCDAAAA